MLKKILLLLVLLFFSWLEAQETNSLYKTTKIAVTVDTIHLEKVSINSNFFKLLDANDKPVDTTFYNINFEKATLVLKEKGSLQSDSITVHYLKLPDVLTKEYSIYDASRVVINEASSESLYQIEASALKKNTPFDGLNTSGSITRGVTIGNNQNTVLNSNLDLQITGKLSEKVSLRASLQDSNMASSSVVMMVPFFGRMTNDMGGAGSFQVLIIASTSASKYEMLL
jgi:hypothetical protein